MTVKEWEKWSWWNLICNALALVIILLRFFNIIDAKYTYPILATAVIIFIIPSIIRIFMERKSPNMKS